MPVFKNEDNGTWYVMARYVNWKGERKQKCKRGFATKREAQEWERMFKLQTSSDLDMSFEAFRWFPWICPAGGRVLRQSHQYEVRKGLLM